MDEKTNTRTPDFETWWSYYKKGCWYLEIKPFTMEIVKGWRHRRLDKMKKTDENNVLITVNGYFSQCLTPEEFSAMMKGRGEGGEE